MNARFNMCGIGYKKYGPAESYDEKIPFMWRSLAVFVEMHEEHKQVDFV